MRESIVQIYLLLFRIFYRIFCLLPVKPVTLFWVTYGDNVKPINDALLTAFPKEKRYLVYDRKFVKCAERWATEDRLPYRRLRFIRLAYLLATSKHIFIDNYIGEFSVAPIRKGTQRVQLWHAAGTLKQFGLSSSRSLLVSKRTRKRFKHVYQRYGDFIVPGEPCATQFLDRNDLPKTVFKPFGVPRTDYWFDEQHQEIKEQLKNAYQQVGRRIILYAPTYREHDGMEGQTVHQLERLTDQGWTILVKLHPTVRSAFMHQMEHIHFVTDEYSINDYLLITDVLVTDYSSIPFESCLLEIPTILYTPDINTYRQLPGIIESYPDPLPVVATDRIETVFDWISSDRALDDSRIAMRNFKMFWYAETPGQATQRIIEFYYPETTN
ncbi:CDP-glycerol:glycerophosphate glycerophosphotransferase [Exiguobacterium antarcticum B7]|nr:CDP-glycerol:glycerophosphate glycerophosphotransferase [Exiguobacterium antarcticum B7]